jgi:hypothetical protein
MYIVEENGDYEYNLKQHKYNIIIKERNNETDDVIKD